MRKSQDRNVPQNPTDPQGQTPLSSCHCPVHCGSVALLNSNIRIGERHKAEVANIVIKTQVME